MRTIIDIPSDVLEEIDAVARQDNISRAEAVRRAMFEYVRNRNKPDPRAGFGIWKGRKVDALAYEDRLRKEWKR